MSVNTQKVYSRVMHPKQWLRHKIAQYLGFVVYDQPFFVREKLEPGEWGEVTRNGYIGKVRKPV